MSDAIHLLPEEIILDRLEELLCDAPVIEDSDAFLDGEEDPFRYECQILWSDGTDDYHNCRTARELLDYLTQHRKPGEPVGLLADKVVRAGSIP